ncbi:MULTISPECIES: UDP-N-acetylmuramoyl-L-alanine--D-glutamate ligase [Vagococcus]|uniref:UDP-N-acetylmuramoylalanine--D-glutamate ligase n=1 Tax=Vagococcus fluvialis bH819 TaxID=1255619 RepID=A0A1X6WM70_9ENTE|nr:MULTISPECIES: UDP-N-acetylmuramoyl-L-alanine--D-glutamate ligase [Vagococcus]SLM85365.1 UDP-N-acetylmuramoylalanine--D-glutamate ligase [Vagococcus fluvialis bH819]HCM89340.1 UDP-N-acetylmuramoyl-L-alanine--D-glutamate ligase [Vagococcus sp.]
MKKAVEYANEKILVLGLAKSGVAAAKLLHQLGAFVTVNDAKKIDENPEAQELLALGMTVITGSHPIDLLDEGFSLIVKNPGIPYTNPILEKAIEKKIPIITEVEVAYAVSEAEFIGITGTNGKTTTTTMIYQLLNSDRQQGVAKLAGNIGYPTSDVVVKSKKEDVLVTELSSFQLMGIEKFKPSIAIVTNLFEAHIDYHGNRQNYVQAKWEIQKNMTSAEYLILNGNQKELRELAEKTKATVMYFSTSTIEEEGAYVLDDSLFYKDEKIMLASEVGVPGDHNIENALAAIIVAKLSGVSNEKIKQTLMNFSGVPHRTEFIGEYKGVKIYNDSKATNILATEKALSGFDNEKLILIVGGLDRGNEFDELEGALRGVKALIATGETADKLINIGKKVGITNCLKVSDMVEAVKNAWNFSEAGDAILLSPACASWDQYQNFEIRGNAFVKEIKQIVSRE